MAYPTAGSGVGTLFDSQLMSGGDGLSAIAGSPTFAAVTVTGLIYESTAIGITAGTTRTQAGAVSITKEINRVDVSTAPAAGSMLGDGIMLMPSVSGLDVKIVNNTSNIITVYGSGSDTINSIAGSIGVAIPANAVEIFECPTSGVWYYDAGVGFSGQLNTVLAVSGITAIGTNQATAFQLVADMNRVTTVAAGTGVILPPSAAGLDILIVNRGANGLQVYGNGSDTVDTVAATAGVSQMPSSVCLYVCATPGTWDSNGIGTGYAGSFPTVSYSNALTAKAGGGQSPSTPVTTVVNRFTTVASANDSATLPTAVGGMQISFTNATASNSINIFPNTGDQINSAGPNTAFSLIPGKTVQLNSAGPTFWHAVLSA